MNQPVTLSDSAALRHLSSAQCEAARIPGIDPSVTPRRIAKVGVVGAGTMAMNFANFSPANVMKLLEVVRSAATSPQVLVTRLDTVRAARPLPQFLIPS